MRKDNFHNKSFEAEAQIPRHPYDIHHDQKIVSLKQRLIVSMLISGVGVIGGLMAVETVFNPDPDTMPVAELLVESAIAVAGIGLGVPIGLDADRRLKAYNQ